MSHGDAWYTEVAKRFADDIADHRLTVEECGPLPFRSILAKRHRGDGWDSCYHFRVITFPGGLLYTGDMGTYVFLCELLFNQVSRLKNEVVKLESKCFALERARDDWRERERIAREALGQYPEWLQATEHALSREQELSDNWFHKAEDLKEELEALREDRDGYKAERDFYRGQLERVGEWADCQAAEYADLRGEDYDREIGWAPCHGGSNELAEILAEVPECDCCEECPECCCHVPKNEDGSIDTEALGPGAVLESQGGGL